MSRIKILYKFLSSKKLIKEANLLLKLADQVNYGIDQNPFKVEISKDVKVDSGMIESETELCNLVNFGIENIEKKYAEQLLKKTKYFPEEINLVHFDINKLINCMIINENSKKDLIELGHSLSTYSAGDRGSGYDKNSFAKIFSKYPNIQKAFLDTLSDEKINYVLIGTSDKTRNFIGLERGAQLFHQNTKRHVIHDLAHALYDVPGAVNRYTFTPIEIMADYLSNVLQEYNKYLKMYNDSVSGSSNKLINFFKSLFGDDKKSDKKEKIYQLFPENEYRMYASINRDLRRMNKFYDLRYLVGTNQGRPKAFTDKSDFDQDFFYYIIDSEGVYDLENDKLLNVFKDPKITPRMERFFDKFFPDTNYKEDFQNKIEKMHKAAMKEIQIDLDEMTHEETGYISFLASMSNSELRGSVYIFNMLSPTIAFIEKKIADKLESMGYTNRPKGSKYLIQEKKRGRSIDALDGLVNYNVVSEDGTTGMLIFVGNISEDVQKSWLRGIGSFGEYEFVNNGDVFYVGDDFLKEIESSDFQEKLRKYFYQNDNPKVYDIGQNNSPFDNYPHKLTIIDDGTASSNMQSMFRPEANIDTVDLKFTVLFVKNIQDEKLKVAPSFASPESINIESEKESEEG